jgi:hypothetical protein
VQRPQICHSDRTSEAGDETSMLKALAGLASIISMLLVARWIVGSVKRCVQQPVQENAQPVEPPPERGRENAEARRDGTASPRRRPIYNYVATATFIVAAVASAIFGVARYSTAVSYAHVPTPPDPQASLVVFFDKPNQDVTIIYRVLRSGRFFIYAQSASSGGADGFLAINSSSVGHMSRAGDPQLGTHQKIQALYSPRGTRLAVLKTESNIPGLWSDAADISPPSRFSITGYDDSREVQTATGAVVPTGSDFSNDNGVSGQFPPIVTTAPAAEAGQLPVLIAPRQAQETSVQIEGYQSRPIGRIVVGGERWYPAARATVHTIVDYTPTPAGLIPGEITQPGTALNVPLPVRYSIARAIPETTDNSELAWSQTGTSQVQWLINNQDALQESSLDLFFAGILFGAAFGFIAVGLERIISLIFRENPE